MYHKIKVSFLLSALLLMGGCWEYSIENKPQELDIEFSHALVDNVSEPASDGLRTVSVSFSDQSGNTLQMAVCSAFRFLEAGYYDIVGKADERLEAMVSLTSGEGQVTVQGGTVYVRRNNDEYDIIWYLATDKGNIRCTASDKDLAFEADEYEHLTGSGGTGTLLLDQTLDSRIMNEVMHYSVCLPEGYDETRKYPVLYLLHGMNGDHNDWFKGGGAMNAYASAFAAEGGPDMIIVSPEGKNLFYCNGYVSGANYMSYFFEEFLPHIESLYSIRSERDSRAIAGLSMGGYGSLYYGLLHPEMFCHAYICSGAVIMIGNCPSLSLMLSNISGEGKIHELPELTFEIGTEDFLLPVNETFLKTMDNNNVAYEYTTRPGNHTWKFWNDCSPKILRKSAAAFGEF